MKLKIGTLNCQNNTENRQNRNDHASLLAEHILERKYDILGTQELTMKFTRRVDSYLKEFDFYGDYQYGRGFIGKYFPIIKTFNQGNQIITHIPVESTRTRTLPWIPFSIKDFFRALRKPSLERRIVTRIELETERERIYILNTHLDYYTPSVQKRQLKYLLKRIKKYKNYGSIVLMGDFNLEADVPLFSNFIEELEKLDIVRVPVNEKTNADKYREKTAIDHIFIPKNWKIIACGTVDMEELSNITDHKAVYVEVDIY